MEAPVSTAERARSIAATLSTRTHQTWIGTENPEHGTVALEGPQNARLVLFRFLRGRPAIAARHRLPERRDVAHLYWKAPKIGCNWLERPAEAVAADVAKRLLPKAETWWQRIDEAIASAQTAEEEQCALVKRLQPFLGTISCHRRPPMLSLWGPPVTIHAEVLSGQRVKLEVDIDGAHRAVAVVEHLASVARDSSDHPACLCGPCEECQHDGHGYDSGESSSGLCHACDVAGCAIDGAVCRAAEAVTD